MKTIDARGKACPEPVILTKTWVDRGEEDVEVLLDNPTSASNVRRFLESKEFSVHLKDDDGLLTISARKKDGRKTAEPQTPVQPETAPLQTLPATPEKETFSVLITCQNLGQSDQQLGEVLMKSFLGTLSQLNDAPVAVALMNEGIKLALYDSSSCDHLKNLDKKGTLILVCGTCVNHFRVAEQIGVGTISNMFEILETLNKASKIITL